MSKNIKEIGKELMGKSLNSFHRKTGLTQLEKNNEIQDGILDGILSQVDDAYIKKTEQSNVIHLEGSGDGVVILDSIEGNTMVNLLHNPKLDKVNNWVIFGSPAIENGVVNFSSTIALVKYAHQAVSTKHNTTYTAFVKMKCTHDFENYPNASLGIDLESYDGDTRIYSADFTQVKKTDYTTLKCKITTKNHNSINYRILARGLVGEMSFKELVLLEGDWTNKEIPPYFEGLQSSFEEKISNQGKYEIEILSQNLPNINLFDINKFYNLVSDVHINYSPNKLYRKNGDRLIINGKPADYSKDHCIYKEIKQGKSYTICSEKENIEIVAYDTNTKKTIRGKQTITIIPQGNTRLSFGHYNGVKYINSDIETKIYIFESETSFIGQEKKNKIKLLLNEPLRSVGTIKDVLCIKNNKLVIERKCGIDKDLHLRNWTAYSLKDEYPDVIGFFTQISNMKVHNNALVCDKLKCMERDMIPGNLTSNEELLSGTGGVTPYFKIAIKRSKLETLNVAGFNTYLQQNPITIVYPLLNPVYEEVLNEYGEPIVLEGYENGTIYIDSTIVPTTTVRYTPKMESFKTLNEVANNNIMLTNDINDSIIPYMMNIDLMIMEKEMALPSQINTRTMEVLDMTSMQKRTQDMLERLIKGKTLTEQQCKDRVVVYLNTNKITSEQADELMILISEIYA